MKFLVGISRCILRDQMDRSTRRELEYSWARYTKFVAKYQSTGRRGSGRTCNRRTWSWIWSKGGIRRKYKPCDLREFAPEVTRFGGGLVLGGCVASFLTQTGAFRHGVGVAPATVQCDAFRNASPLVGEIEAYDLLAYSEISLSASFVSESTEKS